MSRRLSLLVVLWASACSSAGPNAGPPSSGGGGVAGAASMAGSSGAAGAVTAGSNTGATAGGPAGAAGTSSGAAGQGGGSPPAVPYNFPDWGWKYLHGAGGDECVLWYADGKSVPSLDWGPCPPYAPDLPSCRAGSLKGAQGFADHGLDPPYIGADGKSRGVFGTGTDKWGAWIVGGFPDDGAIRPDFAVALDRDICDSVAPTLAGTHVVANAMRVKFQKPVTNDAIGFDLGGPTFLRRVSVDPTKMFFLAGWNAVSTGILRNENGSSPGTGGTEARSRSSHSERATPGSPWATCSRGRTGPS